MVQERSLEESYEQVTQLYDLADALIATVESTPGDKAERHFHLVNPLVEQIEESADILTDEFIKLAEQKGKARPSGRARIEMAFRKVYAALDQFRNVKNAPQGLVQAVSARVAPVMEQIRLHVEKLIVIFLGFVELALDRIMHKADLENLRKRDNEIAALLHQMAAAKGT